MGVGDGGCRAGVQATDLEEARARAAWEDLAAPGGLVRSQPALPSEGAVPTGSKVSRWPPAKPRTPQAFLCHAGLWATETGTYLALSTSRWARSLRASQQFTQRLLIGGPSQKHGGGGSDSRRGGPRSAGDQSKVPSGGHSQAPRPENVKRAPIVLGSLLASPGRLPGGGSSLFLSPGLQLSGLPGSSGLPVRTLATVRFLYLIYGPLPRVG